MRLNAPGEGRNGGLRRPSARALRNGVRNGGCGLASAARFLRRALTQPPQTGWFVESLLTQTLIIHVIRTNKIPFLQSRASLPLMVTTGAIMLFGVWLPSSPLAPALGLTHLPHLYWPLIAVTLLAYMALTQFVKTWLHRRR